MNTSFLVLILNLITFFMLDNSNTNGTTACKEYMAPEMILMAGHHLPVDAWAVGTLFCEMLTGYTPFVAAG